MVAMTRVDRRPAPPASTPRRIDYATRLAAAPAHCRLRSALANAGRPRRMGSSRVTSARRTWTASAK
eukprot:8268321-Pyramimonas_sp.AAC.1